MRPTPGRTGASPDGTPPPPPSAAGGTDPPQAPRGIAPLADLVDARDHRIFFGAYDPSQKPIGLMERVTRAMPATRDLLPAGDFRGWDEIHAWAGLIADELNAVPAR